MLLMVEMAVGIMKDESCDHKNTGNIQLIRTIVITT